MRCRLIQASRICTKEWRNGRGFTRELLAEPEARWLFRVSVAEVSAHTTFSFYPGVERFLAVIGGEGIRLKIGNVEYVQCLLNPVLHFWGDAAVSCQLINGPTRVLNLMLCQAEGYMQPVNGDEVWQASTSACGIFATQAGDCLIGGSGNDKSSRKIVHMPALSLLWFDLSPQWLQYRPQNPASINFGYWLGANRKIVRPGQSKKPC